MLQLMCCDPDFQEALEVLATLDEEQLASISFLPQSLAHVYLVANDLMYLPPGSVFVDKATGADNLALRCSSLLFTPQTMEAQQFISNLYAKRLVCASVMHMFFWC